MSRPKLFKYRPNAYHHVTFPTKRRKKILAGEVKELVHLWFGKVASEHDIKLLEHNSWLDHVHMLIFVRIGEDLSKWMNLLKGTTARRVFQELEGLKSQIGESHLWAKRFRADEVSPEGVDAVREYIRDQENIHLRRMGLAPLDWLERWRDLDAD